MFKYRVYLKTISVYIKVSNSNQQKILEKYILQFKTIKMFGKIILICAILGAVNTETVRRSITPNDIISSLLSDRAESFEIAVEPETITSLVKIVKSVIGYKISALSLAVNFVHWVASNFVGIAIGGFIALGICKVTGKCNLNYDQTFSKLSDFITPERLEMAQRLFVSAMRRFGQQENGEEMDLEFSE